MGSPDIAASGSLQVPYTVQFPRCDFPPILSAICRFILRGFRDVVSSYHMYCSVSSLRLSIEHALWPPFCLTSPFVLLVRR